MGYLGGVSFEVLTLSVTVCMGHSVSNCLTLFVSQNGFPDGLGPVNPVSTLGQL